MWTRLGPPARELGVTASYTELEDLLFPLDLYSRPGCKLPADRHRHRGWRPAGAAPAGARARGDPRRTGAGSISCAWRTSAETQDKTAALYTVLLDKSRDEIEQLIHAREQALPPRDPAVPVRRLDLERPPRATPARRSSSSYDPFESFAEEVCRLAADPDFWRGYLRSGRLPEPLVRYLILYFDTTPDEPVRFARFDLFLPRPSLPPHCLRRHRPGSRRPNFSGSMATKASLSRRELIRLYRCKAHELHPDKGGDTDRLSASPPPTRSCSPPCHEGRRRQRRRPGRRGRRPTRALGPARAGAGRCSAATGSAAVGFLALSRWISSS